MSDDKSPSTFMCALAGIGGAAVAYGAMCMFAGKTDEKIGALNIDPQDRVNGKTFLEWLDETHEIATRKHSPYGRKPSGAPFTDTLDWARREWLSGKEPKDFVIWLPGLRI